MNAMMTTSNIKKAIYSLNLGFTLDLSPMEDLSLVDLSLTIYVKI